MAHKVIPISYTNDFILEGLMKKIELLAPAKDLECGIAAINCGADAVYIGAACFGAREDAGNGLDDLETMVNYAHKYWAKVYVTVNTILRDDEIPRALKLVHQLYNIGADGIILQDVGLLECGIPPIPIIASTQMHNNTPEKVTFLEQIGIKRAILPRELSLDEIKRIRERTSIELECFIHGSLCVSYSGQCYLSYALGRRSGNRGECAQPCRKPYSLIDGSGKALARNAHLLSLKDLNLSEHLPELIQAGVTSFKIEGRLKDKAYVSNVVSYYRAKLDEILADQELCRSSSGASDVDFMPNVEKTFNRGYTTHFLNGRGEPSGCINTPKMLGETIGKVVAVYGRNVTIDTKVPMHCGDGICFFDRSGELRGTVINGVNEQTVIPYKLDGLAEDVLIYRNHDHEFLTKLDNCHAERRIDVKLTLGETSDGFVLQAVDEDGIQAEYRLQCEKTRAEKPEQALTNIRKQLLKSGNTDFACVDVTVDLPEVYFMPISQLNTLRRNVLDELASSRAANRPKSEGKIIKNDIPYPAEELSYLGNVLNRYAAAFYRRHGITSMEHAAETGLDLHGRKVMTTRHCVKHQLGLCAKYGGKSIAVQSLALIDGEGHKLDLRFDCARCEMEVYLGK